MGGTDHSQMEAVMPNIAKSRSGQRMAHTRKRKILIAGAVLCGIALLYSLPIVKIPLINTPQVSFASVLFYPIGIYALLAIGLDMTVGRSGQLNLGYAALFAVGAYTTALLSTVMHMPYYATIIPAIILSMALGLAVGLVSLRVSGDYFAIVTLGIGLVVQEVIANIGILGKTLGISSIPPPGPIAGLTFGPLNLASYDWLLFTMIIIVCAVFALIYRSPIGRAWSAIRDDEGAAALMGVRTRRLKVLASTIGGAPAGLAGSIYAAQVGYISPATFGLTLSILVLAAVTLGGKGRLAGVILGAVVVGYLPERFLALDKIHTLLFGAVITLVMLFRPDGIWGSFAWLWSGRRPDGENGQPAAGIPARAMGDISHIPAHAENSMGDSARPRQNGNAIESVHVCALDTESKPALVVEHARVAFGGVIALNGVSLSTMPGTVTSVIGPNGAGKTTLINAITGVYRLESGRICLGDRDVTTASSATRSLMGIGRTFQNIRLFGGMTALENVLVAAEARRRCAVSIATDRELTNTGHRDGSAVAEARGLLDIVGLTGFAATCSAQLSYGAQRRLEMARALALNPKVLLLDEPAAGANTAEKRELTRLIGRLAESGRSVLLIEHDVRLVMEISSKVVVLNFGKVIANGSPDEIQRDPNVISAYLGDASHA